MSKEKTTCPAVKKEARKIEEPAAKPADGQPEKRPASSPPLESTSSGSAQHNTDSELIAVKRQKVEMENSAPALQESAGDDSGSDDCVFLGAVHVDLPQQKCTAAKTKSSRPVRKGEATEKESILENGGKVKEQVMKTPVTPLPSTPMTEQTRKQTLVAQANNLRRASTESQFLSPSLGEAPASPKAPLPEGKCEKKDEDVDDEQEDEPEEEDDQDDNESKNEKRCNEKDQPKESMAEGDTEKEKGKGRTRARKPKTEEQKKLHARFMRFTRSIQRTLTACAQSSGQLIFQIVADQSTQHERWCM